MFRLTREVRFAINRRPDEQLQSRPTNSFGGYPSLTGLGYYFALQVTLEGGLQPDSGYLRNIKEIDSAIRQRVVPLFDDRVRSDSFAAGGVLLVDLFSMLRDQWPGTNLTTLRLALSPFLSLSILRGSFR